MGESTVRRLLQRFGVALAALVFSAQSAFALVTAPNYLLPSGVPAAAIGIICINPDTTSCTFGGGGITGYAQGSTTAAQIGPLNQCATLTSAPTYTTLTTNPCQTDIHGSAPVLIRDNTGANVDLSPGAAGIGATAAAPPANAVLQGVVSNGVLTAPIACDKSVVYDAATSGETQLVAASGSTVIYVCGYTMHTQGTVSVNLASADTGGACANPVKITPAYALTAADGAVDGSPTFRGLKAPAGKALCWNSSAGVAAQGIVYYGQFLGP
jgi:hypothetical protein